MDLATWMTDNKVIDQDVADAIGITRAYLTRIRLRMVHPNLGTALRVWDYTRREVDLYAMLPGYLQMVPVEPLVRMDPGAPSKARPKKAVRQEPVAAGKPQTQPAPKVYRPHGRA
jgi:hypothetical protein